MEEVGTETIAGAKELMKWYWDVDIPAYLHGPPGVGKSDICRQLADEADVGFKDIRLATKLPEDLTGIPVPDLEARMAVWMRAEFWPDAKRDGKRGIILFDEMSDVPRNIQSAAYQVILNRQIADYKLPDGWWPCAAGNRRQDKAAAQAISTALANRFAHIHVMPDPEAFVLWCNQHDINPLIPAFIRFAPRLLHSMEGASLLAFPSPRAWAQVSKVVDAPTDVRYRLVRGLIGDGPAGEFNAFMKGLDLPDLKEILTAPSKCRIPGEPASRYALASMLARYATRDNFDKIMAYAKRSDFGRDFEICMGLDATKRDVTLCETKAWIDFANRNQDLQV